MPWLEGESDEVWQGLVLILKQKPIESLWNQSPNLLDKEANKRKAGCHFPITHLPYSIPKGGCKGTYSMPYLKTPVHRGRKAQSWLKWRHFSRTPTLTTVYNKTPCRPTISNCQVLEHGSYQRGLWSPIQRERTSLLQNPTVVGKGGKQSRKNPHWPK